MDALSFMTHSGSSPGASNDSFVCSGGSPGIGSGFSFSGNSPTRPLVRPASRVSLTQSFHSDNFRAVEVKRPSAPVRALGGISSAEGPDTIN